AELPGDARVGKARTERRIEDPGLARIGALALAHDEGRPAHALDAAGDEQRALAAARRPPGIDDGGEAAAAEAIDGQPADRRRQPAEKGGMARDVAGILA